MGTPCMTETVQLAFTPTNFSCSQAQALSFKVTRGGGHCEDQMPREQGVTPNGVLGVHNGQGITSSVNHHGGHHYSNHGQQHSNNNHHPHHYNNNNTSNNNEGNNLGNNHNGTNNRGQPWSYRSRGASRFRCDNMASTQNIHQNLQCIARFGGLPWKKPDRQYKPGVEGLTEEIQDFCKYITPTTEEHAVRESIVNQLSELIMTEWPHAELHVFGSFRTNLYLPTGDIDLVIQGNWGHIPPLFDLERFLVEKGFCDRSSLRVLDKATVPLIKFRDRNTDIAVDISLNQVNCTKAADFVSNCIQRFPCLTPLTMVLKQFLSERNLNEVFFGGLSSYSLVLMILTFLQVHHNKEMVCSQKPNLGQLLLDFLEFFGEKFDYENYGLRIKQGGQLVKKEDLRREMVCALAGAINPIQAGNPSPQCVLTIEDPVTPGNDVARASYSVGTIKEEFKLAHQYLQIGVRDDRDPTHSILGRIIRVTDPVVYQRLRIRQISQNLERRVATSNTSNQENKDNIICNNNGIPTPVSNTSIMHNRRNSSGNHKTSASNKSNGVHTNNGYSPGRKISAGGLSKRRNNNHDLTREMSSSPVNNNDEVISTTGGNIRCVAASASSNNRHPSTPITTSKDISSSVTHSSKQNNKEQAKTPTESSAVVGNAQTDDRMTASLERYTDQTASDSALSTETYARASSLVITGSVDGDKEKDKKSDPTGSQEKTSTDTLTYASMSNDNINHMAGRHACSPPKENSTGSSLSCSLHGNRSNLDDNCNNPTISCDNGPVTKGTEDDRKSLHSTQTANGTNRITSDNHIPTEPQVDYARESRPQSDSTKLSQIRNNKGDSSSSIIENHLEREAFDRIIFGDSA